MRTLIHCQAISSRCYVLACDYWDSNGKTSPTSNGRAPKNLVTRVREIWKRFNLRREGSTYQGSNNEKLASTNVLNSVWLRNLNPGTMARGGCFHRGALLYMKKSCPGSREDHPPTRATLGKPTVANHLHKGQKFSSTRSVTHLAGSPFHDGIGSPF